MQILETALVVSVVMYFKVEFVSYLLSGLILTVSTTQTAIVLNANLAMLLQIIGALILIVFNLFHKQTLAFLAIKGR